MDVSFGGHHSTHCREDRNKKGDGQKQEENLLDSLSLNQRKKIKEEKNV